LAVSAILAEAKQKEFNSNIKIYQIWKSKKQGKRGIMENSFRCERVRGEDHNCN